MPRPSSIPFHRSPLFSGCCVIALLAAPMLQLAPPFPAIGVLGVGIFVLWVMKPTTRVDANLAAAFALLVLVQAAAGGAFVPVVSEFGAAPAWQLPFMTITPQASSALAGAGFVLAGCALLARSTHELREAQQTGRLATGGPYAYLRHPQGVALMWIAIGLLLPWPSIAACALLIACIVLIVRAARADEEALALQFGLSYAEYANAVQGWVPRLFRDRHWPAPTSHGPD